jgi:N-acetylgalactosamine kinase
MGVHIDHRGGYTNYICIAREILMVCQKRGDDRVVLHNIDPRFGPTSFNIGQELPESKRGNWMRYIEQVEITPGHWSNYIKAAVLRLQERCEDKALKGMNIMVNGDIPSSAGLSSSSALVVATALAMVRLNNLDISREELVELCAQGEWYVGTRGGAGDQAAMLFGKGGYITHMRFFPFRQDEIEYLPFPLGYKALICNSLRHASKSGSERSAFNQTIAAYETVLMLIREILLKEKGYSPQFVKDRVKHLRDVNERTLGVGTKQIYEILRYLPDRMTRQELLTRLSSHRERLLQIFKTHEDPPDGYKVRQVGLFGLAECQRGEITAQLLRNGEIDKFGQLMYISHNGDRAVNFAEDGTKKKWDNRADDEYLDRLIGTLESPDPVATEGARLYMQPGGYGASCEEMDQMVDIARRVPGVVGAGLTGAGLGGCILILVKDENAQNVINSLTEKYYLPRGLSPAVEVCVLTEGAEIIDSEECEE